MCILRCATVIDNWWLLLSSWERFIPYVFVSCSDEALCDRKSLNWVTAINLLYVFHRTPSWFVLVYNCFANFQFTCTNCRFTLKGARCKKDNWFPMKMSLLHFTFYQLSTFRKIEAKVSIWGSTVYFCVIEIGKLNDVCEWLYG